MCHLSGDGTSIHVIQTAWPEGTTNNKALLTFMLDTRIDVPSDHVDNTYIQLLTMSLKNSLAHTEGV